MGLMANLTELDYITVIFPPANGTSTWIIVFVTSSSIGLVLSAVAFTLLILTAIRFPEWRQTYKNQLLVQFMLARIIYAIVRYMYDMQNIFALCDLQCVIFLDGFVITYTEVLLVSWMLVFTKHMHDSLVKVFNVDESKIWMVSFWTWFSPGVLTCILFLSYNLQDGKDILYYLIYLFLVKWPVLSVNAAFLISILKSILRNNQSTENNLRITIVMVMLIFMLSFQQIIIDIYKLIYIVILNNYVNYLLSIGSVLVLYHCAFSILFWIFGNANTRKLWSSKKVRPHSQIINRNSIL